MKHIKKTIGIIVFILFTTIAFAQAPPPPNNGTTGSGGGTPVGGGAPIADGLIMLISASLIYAISTKKHELLSIIKKTE